MTTTTINPEQTELEDLAVESQRLIEAQQAIREIEARRAERQKASDIALLAKVRAELHERQTFYEQNLPAFRQQEMDYANGRDHVISARNAVAESQRHMPAVAVFLPSDVEVVRWRKRHAALEQRLAEMQAEFDHLPDPETLRLALVYAGEAISQLSYSCQNLTRKLSGETATWIDGGVSNVGGGTPPGCGKSSTR